jgi:hypothetical protein
VLVVSSLERKQSLFEQILRLRRAGHALPGNEDIAAVRVALEQELGETVSQRLAARLLGVSHSGLDRWIRSGDLPVVYAPNGRMQVPVAALLDLYELVQRNRAKGHGRYVIAPAVRSQRRDAQRLEIGEPAGRGADDRHDRALARGLAYHRAVAQRLRRPMVDEARHVLYRWKQQGRIDPRYAERWEQVLSRPIREIRDALTDESPAGDDLRQNSPFAGLLSEPERRRILEKVS